MELLNILVIAPTQNVFLYYIFANEFEGGGKCTINIGKDIVKLGVSYLFSFIVALNAIYLLPIFQNLLF